MKKVTDECCDCATGLYPCLGSSCPNRHVTRYYCDKCGDEFETDELYEYDNGEQLCGECLLLNYKTVAQEEG